MSPNQFLPDFVFDDPQLLPVYTFCLSRLSPGLTKMPIGKRIVTLRPNEVVIRKPLDVRLSMSDEQFESKLVDLKNLDIAEFESFDTHWHVRLPKIHIPVIQSVTEQDGSRERPDIVFSAYCEQVLSNVKQNLAPKTLETYARVTTHAKKKFGDSLVSKLEPHHFEEYKINRRESDGVSVGTVNMDLRVLKSTMQFAIVWGYRNDNPARCIKPIRQERQLPHPLSKEEFGEVLLATEDQTIKSIYQCWFVSGCTANKTEEIVVGHISPLTGDEARWGKWESEGIDLAVEEINSRGGVKGRKLKLIHEDDKGDPKAGVAALQKLISQGVQVVIGATLSGVTLACAPVAEKNKVVLLTPSAQSPKISDAGDYIFRIFASSSIEGSRIVDLSLQFNLRNASVLYANTAYGVGLHDVVKKKLSERGIQVLADEGYDPDTKDYRLQLQRVKNVKADCIYLLGFPNDMGTILRQMKELGISGLKFAPNSFEATEIIELAKGGAEGVYYVYPILDSAAHSADVSQRFMNKFNKPMNYYNGVGYDAVNVLSLSIADALNRDAHLKGELVKDALYKVNGFPGVTGPITFDKNGDVVDRPMEFRVVRNSQFQSVKEEMK